ncbi:MAG: hypothetical protein HY328_10260 [Chloroflexi bacterium]|nr:hypothetical protein [Chloroflexota bacterium]
MVAAIQALPQTGHLEVNIRVSAAMNVSSFAARQKADNFILGQISYMMHAGEPELVLSNRILWRVPVILSQRSAGDVGQVGVVDVDVETGRLSVSPAQIAEIQERAKKIAQRDLSEPHKQVSVGDFELAWLERDYFYAVITVAP